MKPSTASSIFAAACVAAAAQTASAQPTREVTYNPRAVVRINAHLRMTSMLILPETEEILDFVCGDKDY